MIRRDKPSGYFQTVNAAGLKVEGETRQCGHCQYIWEYRPGSGRRSGLCTACKCLICARPECLKDQQEKRAILQFQTGKTYNCVPFDEWNYHLMEKAARTTGKLGTDFGLTDQGFIVRPSQ
jgi:hypothetical protein